MAMWNKQSLESKIEEALIGFFGKDTGADFFTRYSSARDFLIEQVYPEIKAAEPALSDHSAPHIANVLRNAEQLLGNELKELTAIEMYCLGLVILFHDVGNIEGRQGHNKNIAQIYNDVRKSEPNKYRQERYIVLMAAGAHTGKAKDGTKDTLKEVEPTTNLDGHPLRLRDIAAIVRFADELAEGYQRTSQFMQTHGKYPKESRIYHEYAGVTNVYIDRLNERVTLTYHIEVPTGSGAEKKLKELLRFIFYRIIKLDEERKYAKFYSKFLLPFKKTTIQINLSMHGHPIDIGLEKIELEDAIPIPGESKTKCEDILKAKSSGYDIEKIWKDLRKKSQAIKTSQPHESRKAKTTARTSRKRKIANQASANK